ncbi:stage V sporulation protein K [Virgibacillus halodenitrificans]|uniref:Stage V sporulation protein K n=1 Tax=Virgibacillus halodenitrificans TaxID=1482 RepID=A0ABR7VQW5_VIRHA|nr:stage V sporulation protein K [Virgibacillus halodenitrificans]MBD1224296.1 stage V sporulation protein K [Virgibacillus halodenitrificans]MCG1028421.1 stage V sporulation protein K [Virgibacillus halodenitrificans]MCJ0931123.1 stage V sporulation protein K [Virgibacillus halodenitrificans]MEC2160929.1 stage V sporulation protein K [Virgibacillus halodenitrificans]WHX27243.1 stage V sporulation protein K [Virgibacillus halodenitrificans]
METQLIRNKKSQINIVLKEQKNDEGKSQKTISSLENNPFTHIDQEFSSIIGLQDLKKTIKEIYATVVINQKRHELGLKSSKQVLHMLFKGNPGTGKTTVARKLAKLYFEMNLLSKGHFIEAERADLVGEYIGQTAQKTRTIIQKAMGGILFIDEAYSLARGGDKDFGKEAIDTLVKHMEDHHNDFVLILAGYPYEMERFLTLNPGLQSRFPFILDFEDYEISQLMKIARQMAAEREYRLTKEAEQELRMHLYKKTQEKARNFSNARYVRNVIENAIRLHAVRLLKRNNLTTDDLITLTEKDLLFDN